MNLGARPLFAVLLVAGALTELPTARAQIVVPGDRHTAHASLQTAGEQHAARAFLVAKSLGAPELYAFLKPMPKGADLHMHLSGAVYAETFIAEAANAGLCVAPPPPACTVGAISDSDSQTPATKAMPRFPRNCPVPVLDPKLPPSPLRFAQPLPNKSCGPGQLPAAEALTNQPLFDALVDSFSMRGYVPTPGVTGHDQFFATFDRFGGLKAYLPEWLDEVASRAAAQNEQYLEIMQTPPFGHAIALAARLGWPVGAASSVTREQLTKLRDALLAGGLRDEVMLDRKEFAEALRGREALEHCAPGADPVDSPVSDARKHERSVAGEAEAEPRAGCAVQLRFLYQVLRAFSPQQVFAQTLLGFETAQAELDSGNPVVVGLNFVQPEDAHLAMRDYHLQMQMMDYLHSLYPRVRITLHAGELTHGMVPPEGLTFHIREAIELGHAERIGHGMDVLYENRADQLLAEMAQKHVMVEVNLTSNDVILGQSHTDHPLAAYRAARVPLALSTDDEGVSRIDLTHEYVKAAEEQNLTYGDLKRSARTSLEHSFLPGPSLWDREDEFTRRIPACAAPITSTGRPSEACASLLKESPRAVEQYELERRFSIFEAGLR